MTRDGIAETTDSLTSIALVAKWPRAFCRVSRPSLCILLAGRAGMRTATLLVLVLWALPIAGQTIAVSDPPPSFVVPNGNGVPAGAFGGLESVAYVARTTDPSAAWFNPAGLSVEQGPQISGSAGIYEKTRVAPEALTNHGGSAQHLPASVGLTMRGNDRLTLGFVLVTPMAFVQRTDAQIVNTISLGDQRFALSTDSEFSQRLAAMSAGYRLTDAWRVGGGLAFEFTSLRLVQSVSDRIADTTTLRTLLVASRASGSALQVRSVVGARYDQPALRVGVAIRTPALTITSGGALTVDGVLDAGATALGASLFDPDADFRSPLPWEVQLGVAYIGSRVQVESDLQLYTAIDRFAMFSTAEPIVVYGDAGATIPPTVFVQPFPGLETSRRGFANASIGGHVRLWRDREIRLHGGLATDRSPLEANDAIFSRINLLSWTVGASGQVGNLRFSVGLNRRSGTSDDVIVRNLIGGRVVSTPLDIRTTGFIYSLAYQF